MQRLLRLDLTAAEIRLPYDWRIGPANRDIGDASYVAAEHTFEGLGLKPLSPVHVRGVRAGGDVAISWIRRTRLGGDSWEAPEVPLGEDTESYEVDILDGARRAHARQHHAVRHLHGGRSRPPISAPRSPAYDMRVYQLSAAYGRGTPREAVV